MNEILSTPYFLLLILIIISAIAMPITSPSKAVKLAVNPNELVVEKIEATKDCVYIDIGMPDDDVQYYYKTDTFNNLQKGNFYYQGKKANAQEKAELIQAVEVYLKSCTQSKRNAICEFLKDMK
jgi:hypothetical protein